MLCLRYKGLETSFYFILWKGSDSLVENSATVIKINGRYATDAVL
jgi:hypothetical protein